MATQGVLQIPTLGRPMQLGMLYDCRSDSLIPGMTLWDPATLQSDRDVSPQPGTHFEIISSDEIDGKARALKVDASLKASFLGGLVKVDGSAKYLNDKKSSQQQCRLTLQYETTTRFEQLTMKQLGRHNVQHPDVFDQGTATHVVTGIVFGAQAFFVFDRECSKGEEVSEVQGRLHGMLKKVVCFEMDGKGSFDSSESESVDKVRCQFHGDFNLDINPSNYKEAVDIYKKLPSMLGDNGEQAVPMRVWLYPLEKLDHKAAKLVREISVNMISQAQAILEGLDQLQIKCKDIARQDACIDFPQFSDKLRAFEKLISDYKLSFQQKLARLLPAIRGGGEEEQALGDAISDSVKSPFSLQGLNDWVRSKEREMNVVKAYMKMFSGIQVIKSKADLEELILNPTIENVICFSVPLARAEEYLKVMSEYLTTCVQSSQPTSSEWFDDASKSKKFRFCARVFAEFCSANADNENTAFAVTGFDDGLEGGPITLYEEGVLISKSFEPPSGLEKPSIKRTSHDEVSLGWPAPKFGSTEVKSYLVGYRVHKTDTKGDWVEVDTASDERSLAIRELQPFTSYEFHVTAVCTAGVSKVSEVSDACTTLPTGPPMKVRKLGKCSSSMTIVWDPPANIGQGVRIEHYIVRYRQITPSDSSDLQQDATKVTNDQSCLLTIDDVQPETTYRVWVSAACGEAGTSMESNPSEIATDSIHKAAKHAKRITEDAEIVSDGCQSKGEPTVYKVPLVQNGHDSAGIYRSYCFGRRPRVDNNKKVILVVGATGAGVP